MKKSRYGPLQEKLQLILILREMRPEAGLRQTDLASLLEQPRFFVSKYESGERILAFLELRQVCAAMGFTMTEFINRFEISNLKSQINSKLQYPNSKTDILI